MVKLQNNNLNGVNKETMTVKALKGVIHEANDTVSQLCSTEVKPMLAAYLGYQNSRKWNHVLEKQYQ